MHRIGRTGRAGNKGASISFFDEEKDSDLARELVKILSGAEQVSFIIFVTSLMA